MSTYVDDRPPMTEESSLARILAAPPHTWADLLPAHATADTDARYGGPAAGPRPWSDWHNWRNKW